MPPDPPGRLERDGQARRGAARSHEFNPNSLQVSLAEIARPSYGDASTVTRALEEGWRRALRHAAADGSITHEEEVGIANQVMLISSTVSHALAWIAYLVVTFGLVVWPAWQDGDGQDLIVLATVFAPVALSGLGLLTVLDPGPTGRQQPDVNYICGLAHLVLWSGNFLYRPDSSAGVGQTDHWTDCRFLPDNPDAGRRSGWSFVAAGDYDGSALGV